MFHRDPANLEGTRLYVAIPKCCQSALTSPARAASPHLAMRPNPLILPRSLCEGFSRGRYKQRAGGDEPFPLWIHREAQSLQGSRTQQREVSWFGKYHFVNREVLVQPNNGKPDVTGNRLAVRHYERDVFLLALNTDFFEQSCGNPGVITAGIDQQLRSDYRRGTVYVVLNFAADVKCAHPFLLSGFHGRCGELRRSTVASLTSIKAPPSRNNFRTHLRHDIHYRAVAVRRVRIHENVGCATVQCVSRFRAAVKFVTTLRTEVFASSVELATRNRFPSGVTSYWKVTPAKLT